MEKLKHETGIRSFYYALKGLSTVFRTELNARLHLAVGLVVVIMGFLFGISRTEWLVIILCISMVIVSETFNTAVERLVDMVSPEINEKAGMVKDMSAGAVLITAAGSVIAGLLIFIPYIKEALLRL